VRPRSKVASGEAGSGFAGAARRIYHAKMEFPVKPGPFTLVYPKWIPESMRQNGPIVDVTGVKFFCERERSELAAKHGGFVCV